MSQYIRASLTRQVVAFITLAALLFSSLPGQALLALAASTGITVSETELTTPVDEQVNFVASVTTSGGTTTPGTVVSVSDNGGGGDFYNGTIGGACSSVTPDANDEFAINQNKGICYSNSATGTFSVTVQLLDGSGGSAIGDPETLTVTVEDDEEFEMVEDAATIVAHKLVCTDPADMPGGSFSGTVGETTASEWAAENDSCDFASGFEFEVAPKGTADPGDELIGSAGEPWMTFGPTNDDGIATTSVSDTVFEGDTFIWAREVLQSGFEIFEHGSNDADFDNLTSEFYCHTDGVNTDNFDRIDGIAADETFYCVAWNLIEIEVPRLEITSPEVDGETLGTSHAFTAEYVDADDIEDDLAWAIRAGGGQCNGDTLAGNVGGATDDFSFENGAFSATVDMSLWEDGEYCLVLNPQESNGEDFRAVRTFNLEQDVAQCTVAVVSDDTNTVVEKDGAFAEILTYNAPSWAQNLTDAEWIWGDDPVADLSQDVSQTFEKTFDWSGPVVTAELKVSADNLFVATINGEFVSNGDGAADTFREDKQVVIDVSDKIIEGENTVSILVTNLSDSRFDSHLQNPAGLLYRLEVNGSSAMCDAEILDDPELEITSPEVDGEELEGEYTFEAEYTDADDVEDTVAWAIRAGGGQCSGETIFGNVGGVDTPFAFDGAEFSTTIDLATLEPGEYCLVVNPQESAGPDVREVRTFVIAEEEPVVCLPGQNLLENPSFEEPVVTKSRGWDLVDPIGWIVSLVSNGNDSQMELQRGVNGWESSDGDQHTELGVKKAAQIAQSIPTVEGKTYVLSWDYSPRPETDIDENRLSVQVDGEEVATKAEAGLEDVDWSTYTYEFEGTGDEVEVVFADHGTNNGKGVFVDNTSLECVPVEVVAFGPYCGDGIVNQDWETCDPGHLATDDMEESDDDPEVFAQMIDRGWEKESCTMKCTSAYQCTDLELAQVSLDVFEGEQPSFNNAVYVGGFDDPIPSEAWFLLEQSDKAANKIANKTDGLGVSWDDTTMKMDVALRGGNDRNEFDEVSGTVTFAGFSIDEVTDRISFTGYELDDKKNDTDTATEESENTVAFAMMADNDKDGFSIVVEGTGEPHTCPDCLAGVEARVILIENGIELEGEAELNEVVYLGDGTTVPFGAWFNVFDGDAFITDETGIRDFENPTELPGLLVSRTGDGTIDMRLVGGYDKPEEGPVSGRESLSARLEIRDASVAVDGVTAAKFESHGNSGFDAFEADENGVNFFMRVGTGSDELSVPVDRFTIAACTFDTKQFTIEGVKWNDLNENGVWDDVEPTMSGWEITVSNGEESFSTLTDETGAYAFTVDAGWWTVSEEDRQFWTQTAPNTMYGQLLIEDDVQERGRKSEMGTCNVFFADETEWQNDFALLAPEFETEGSFTCNFGNYFSGYVVDGVKYFDENENGVRDEGEPTLSGWEIELSDGENVMSTVTDDNGFYSFTFDQPGEWTVSEIQQEGWVQTAPASSTCSALFGVAEEEEGENEEYVRDLTCDFGNYFEGIPEEPGPLACSINTSDDLLPGGGEAVLTWDTNGALEVFIDQGIGTTTVDGSAIVTIDTTTTFTLTARGSQNTLVNCDVTIGTNNGASVSGASGNGGSSDSGGRVLGVSATAEDAGQVLGADTTRQCGALLEDYLAINTENDSFEVSKLQLFLNGQGISAPSNSVFDEATEAAVSAFQVMHTDDILQPWLDAGLTSNLDPSGRVYKTTRWKINNIVCPGSEALPTLP